MDALRIAEKIVKSFVLKNTLGLDPLTQKVAEFLNENPNKKDADFHAWAEKEKLNVHSAEAAAYRLATFACEFLFNGRAAEKGVTEKDVDISELSAGMEVEMEHTSNIMMAKRISLDHLAEAPTDAPLKYYTALKLMERIIERLSNMSKVDAKKKIGQLQKFVSDL